MNEENKVMPKEEKTNKKKYILLILLIGLFMLSVVGMSFAAFTFAGTGTQENTISTGTITMAYTEEDDGISITNALPMSDAAGIAQTADEAVFDFTVSATISGSTTIGYEISATKKTIASNPLENDDIKLYLAETTSGTPVQVMGPTHYVPATTETPIGTPVGSMVMYAGSFSTNATRTYSMKMWLADDYLTTPDSQTFTVTVNVYGKAS